MMLRLEGVCIICMMLVPTCLGCCGRHVSFIVFGHHPIFLFPSPSGKAGELIDRGDNTYGGKWVVNPSGGLISKGHPLGATGERRWPFSPLTFSHRLVSQTWHGVLHAMNYEVGMNLVQMWVGKTNIATLYCNATLQHCTTCHLWLLYHTKTQRFMMHTKIYFRHCFIMLNFGFCLLIVNTFLHLFDTLPCPDQFSRVYWTLGLKCTAKDQPSYKDDFLTHKNIVSFVTTRCPRSTAPPAAHTYSILCVLLCQLA